MENNLFQLVSKFEPAGDQPKAINQLVAGIKNNQKHQVLLGATGTGKTYTMAQVIAKVNKPTLVFAHNKTLVGQLYNELKSFFPYNRVEYFVSNFDFYQPEAYVPKTDTYIEKSAMVNQELEMLRLSAMISLLQRPDTIVVCSVACIYASSDPRLFLNMKKSIYVGQMIARDQFLLDLVYCQYVRNDVNLERGCFRVRGDIVDICLGYRDDFIVRISFFGDEIESICEWDNINNHKLKDFNNYDIFPAKEYARKQSEINAAATLIEQECAEMVEKFIAENKLVEAQRLKQRVEYDVESLRNIGYCSGIENYAQYIDGRSSEQRPYNLFDYFLDDYLVIIDESHASIPQIRGMYEGDRSRKQTLVDYGFRLPSALNNRPMTFSEFEKVVKQVIYVSATPSEYELALTNQQVVEQIIRPTGLLDPIIEVRPTLNQIDDLMLEIKKRIELNERTIVTTLSIDMAQSLVNYLRDYSIKVDYIQHEIKTLERLEILRRLRLGEIDVVIGINLLREGIDLPEVSLIAILDANVSGLFRSYRSLIQMIGRVARNANGKAIMYADSYSEAMTMAIRETERRRKVQEEFNLKHNIIPQTIYKKIPDSIYTINSGSKKKAKRKGHQDYTIDNLRELMLQAAKDLDFELAAQYRDLLYEMEANNEK